MRTKTSSARNKKKLTKRFSLPSYRLHLNYFVDIARMSGVAFSIFLIIALITPSAVGILGAFLARQFLYLFGPGAYVVAATSALLSWSYIFNKEKNSLWFSFGFFAGLAALSILAHSFFPHSAGVVGATIFKAIKLYLGTLGIILTTSFLLCLSIIFIRQKSFVWPKFSLRKKIPIFVSEPVAHIENIFERSDMALPDTNFKTIQKGQHLTEALHGFGITGSVIDIKVGPVVSTFAFKIDHGMRQSKIFSIAKDLALHLRVETLSVVQLPELQAVGFQIPNDEPKTILFGDLIQDPSFVESNDPLKFIIGRDVAGAVICESLAKLPHLLIAGSTGSGKSIGIHCFLCSLLVAPARSDIKLVLIDPKMLELAPYAGIPNLLYPIITDESHALTVMEELVKTMNARYKLMAEHKVRDIVSFNKKRPEPLPYIVLVIDEYAELALMTNRKIETPLVQLAQKARASGIHIVLSTQRPSIDVITGLIKANFPARLSYKVASGIDSRTILNQLGAEKLLGRGDLLFYKPGYSHPKRFHGPYVDETSVERLVQRLKSH